jgi:nucleoside-diphosphate-sugar epimerase
MRVFLCGRELGLGFVIARRLVAAGHKVNILTRFPDLVPNLTKHGLNPLVGEITDEGPQRALAKADAVIDAAFPLRFPKKRVHIAGLLPIRLRDALRGSGRVLVVTSNSAVLGDTGTRPLAEDAHARPLPGFSWALRVEKAMCDSSRLRAVVIRPAWLIHGPGQGLGGAVLNNWIPLSWRLKRGTYIGDGSNLYSAIHLDDLAELYCLALEKARGTGIVHAAAENLSLREIAASIHRAMQLKGEPSGISLRQAQRLTPIADRLTISHALCADRARATLGWSPASDSVLRAIEEQAAAFAWARRKRIPATECRRDR